LYVCIHGAKLIEVLLVAQLLLSAAAMFLAAAIWKLCRTSRIEEITPEWLHNFPISAYQPIEGLLAREDFVSLAGQPGFDVSQYRNLRRERLRTFRQYLIRLVSDFNLLHLRARGVIAVGAEDRSDLVSKLISLKFRFSMALLRAKATYLFFRSASKSLAFPGTESSVATKKRSVIDTRTVEPVKPETQRSQNTKTFKG
jgi:hypothetical protein